MQHGTVQFAKSLFWRNRAAFGGGAYLRSGNKLVTAPQCELLPERDPIFLPVHFLDSAFIDNTCGPAKAGASVFWNTPYLLHVTCSDGSFLDAIYQPSLSNCSFAYNIRAQRYCHQCVLVDGCSDWQGNVASSVESSDAVNSQSFPTETSSSNTRIPVVIVPFSQSKMLAAQAESGTVHAAEVARSPRRLSITGRPDGMASGGVNLRTWEPRVTGYAAGSEMSVSVDLLDAYGQIVNTDQFIATRPGTQVPFVTVSGPGDVFLSGQLTQPFKAGVAELAQMRLIGNPGVYQLLLESPGADSTSVEVCTMEVPTGTQK